MTVADGEWTRTIYDLISSGLYSEAATALVTKATDRIDATDDLMASSSKLLALVGYCQWKAQNYREAALIYKELESRGGPRMIQFSSYLCECLYLAGEVSKAREVAEAALSRLEVCGASSSSNRGLGSSFSNSKPKIIGSYFNEAGSPGCQDVAMTLKHQLLRCHLFQGDVDAAEKAAGDSPWLLGLVHYTSCEYERALECFSGDPESIKSPESLIAQALCHSRISDSAAALAVLDRIPPGVHPFADHLKSSLRGKEGMGLQSCVAGLADVACCNSVARDPALSASEKIARLQGIVQKYTRDVTSLGGDLSRELSIQSAGRSGVNVPGLPSEVLLNLMLLYCGSDVARYDLCGDLAAEYPQLIYSQLDPDQVELIEAVILSKSSPADGRQKASSCLDSILASDKAGKLSQVCVALALAAGSSHWDAEQYSDCFDLLTKYDSQFSRIFESSQMGKLRLAIGHTLFVQQKHEDAIEYYEAALEAGVSSATCNLVVCYVLCGMNEMAESLVHLQADSGLLESSGSAEAVPSSTVNLVVATLYCSKMKFEFGMESLCRVALDTFDTWVYVRRCMVWFLRCIGRRAIVPTDACLEAAFKILRTGCFSSLTGVAQQAEKLKDCLLQLIS